ncbi:MAG TPA: serine hydrolase domain-containing protein [Acidimicrobiales bacterium]
MSDIQGHVAPGFEKVRDAIDAREAPWGRCGGSIAAYVDGKLVVDLWGGEARPGQPWREETLSPVASVTKSWAAVVIGKLFEQGVVDWTTPICTWWPEFAEHGKESVTLNEIFAHSSGVLSFDNAVEMLDANDCQGWLDLDGIAAALAASKPSWTPGTRNGYHAVSYGWLLNEVVRRTTGRTIGETFATDFAKPLELDTYIGTHGADLDRVAYMKVADLTKAPRLQRMVMQSMTRKGSDPSTLFGRALLADGHSTILDRVEGYTEKSNFLEAEIPASNGTTTARSLARLFAALANEGSLDGVEVLAPATVQELRTPRAEVRDTIMTEPLPFFLRPLLPKGRVAYGLMPIGKALLKLQPGPAASSFMSAGFGGQFVIGDSESKVSFASTCTDFTPGLDVAMQKSALNSLYGCL